MPLPLIALIVASFAIGTSEFVIVGLVPDLARDFSVSVPQAGYLVTAYALGVTFGSPFIAVLVGRWQRRTALITLMGVFVLGNALCALAPGYWTMMAARIITALSHGAFFGIGSVVAADLVPREKRARAVALVFLGLTMANVLGVPAGTILGQEAGWRATFWAVMAIGLVSMAAIALLLPRNMQGGNGRLLNEIRILGRPQVLLAMLMAVLSSMSLFSVFTYIAPLLENVSLLSPHWVSIALLIFGAGLTAGGLLGGRLADQHSARTIMLTFTSLIIILTTLRLVSPNSTLAIITLLVWGIAVFTMVSPLQTRVIDYARDAPNLASTINQGAFNLGNAAGAWIGGAALGAGVTYLNLPLVGALMATLGLGVALMTFRLERQGKGS